MSDRQASTPDRRVALRRLDDDQDRVPVRRFDELDANAGIDPAG
ncbi:MAG: hypothetical protein U5K33_02540 [Halofilum sp. (in: g-proteobacteria)]|nr:hypothetical protein [Halofilum sp. (in: g-proteobacteria)]